MAKTTKEVPERDRMSSSYGWGNSRQNLSRHHGWSAVEWGRDAVAGAEGEGRLGTGRALTVEKQERILGSYPGDVYGPRACRSFRHGIESRKPSVPTPSLLAINPRTKRRPGRQRCEVDAARRGFRPLAHDLRVLVTALPGQSPPRRRSGWPHPGKRPVRERGRDATMLSEGPGAGTKGSCPRPSATGGSGSNGNSELALGGLLAGLHA